MVPFTMKNFRLRACGEEDMVAAAQILIREGEALGTGVEMEDAATLKLKW